MNDELRKIKMGLPTEQWESIVRECKRLNLPLEEYFKLNVRPEPRRKWMKTQLKEICGKDAASVVAGSKRAGKVKIVIEKASRFYNADHQLKGVLQESIDRQMSMQPMRDIDPKSVQCEQLTGLEFKRAVAVKYIKKYRDHDRFLNKLAYNMRRYPLTEKQCDMAIKIGNEFKIMDRMDRET